MWRKGITRKCKVQVSSSYFYLNSNLLILIDEINMAHGRSSPAGGVQKRLNLMTCLQSHDTHDMQNLDGGLE